VDDEGDELTSIKVIPNLKWVTISFKTKMVKVDASLLELEDVGIQELKIVLTDEFNASRICKQVVMVL
jgi:hypothetical protein